MEENKYSRSKVYKLVDQINNYFYIGSTTSELSKRLSWHKQHIQQHPDRKLNRYMDTVGKDNFKIILIEEFNLSSTIQLLREEDKYIQQYINDDKCLNSFRAMRSPEERKVYHENYRNEHPDEKLEYMK